MKRYVHNSEQVFGMSNLPSKHTGLKVRIWADSQGSKRNKSDVVPRVKLDYDDDSISVSIEKHPRVLAPKGGLDSNFKKSVADAFREGIEYIARNYDLFLKHYNDVEDEFTDVELFEALRERGDFK